jgi:cytosine/adenosine deaminase-related metal-dependent hydrolase
MSEPTAESVIYTARWVFPVAGPPLPGGTVTASGDWITAVEPHGVRTADVDFGNAALIPGLVNAHTHLDLSGARGLIPPTDPDHFTDWLRGVIAYRRSRSPEQVQADIRTGLAECLRSGTTLLGDITADGGSWAILADFPVRAVVFREFIGLKEERSRVAWFDMVIWAKDWKATPATRPGVSPHAPYSASWSLLRRACQSGLPLTTHWLEAPGEQTLIDDHSGPFRTFLADLGVLDETQLIPDHEFTLAHASVHARSLILAHANYQPVDVHWQPNTTVVYCPRTHAAFGHPPHPFREFLARGVRVCLGTDGLASNPNLDVLAEARFVAARYPEFPRDTLLRMVTLSGAEALGWADEAGSLEPGKSADFVAIPLPNRDAADPHELLFTDHPGDRTTVFRGTPRN